ncbi:site-specific recombinase, phage integrase family [Bacteriovorax sp. BSW11_IV]|uniref:tyrosine-type recombinase/integrase n=1 Tax=Bacteriovorax sp. BSW11_IV TaxID=1353529 RepID=UPI000389FF53|nr:tyrosine-type recombinase/integrase [Bacteriovorax sp. BSW11_IV]EQC43660.1 site-specific recombinase, phage integrase family [Bacteriovorax sp. BSW11_IV]
MAQVHTKQAKEKEHDFILFEEFFENFTSEHTRSNYMRDIEQFLSWINFYFKISDYKKIERIHIIKYRNYLTEAGGRDGSACAPKTIGRKLASISSYFHYLVERGQSEFNPATSVKRPRTEVITPTNALTGDQVRELLGSIDQNKHAGPMHRALLLTFFTTGLRKSEVLNLKFKNYKRIGPNTILEFKGKGGKLGQKLLHPSAIEALESYFSWMENVGRKLEDNDWLFQPTKNPSNPENLNRPLNPKTINEILQYYAKKIGIFFKVSPHSCRATFIGELLELGVDIYTVAREVNHSSVKTTQEYDKRRKKLSDSPVHKLDF